MWLKCFTRTSEVIRPFALDSSLPFPLFFLVFLGIVKESTSWQKTHVCFFRPDHKQWQRLSPHQTWSKASTLLSLKGATVRGSGASGPSLSLQIAQLQVSVCLRSGAELFGEDRKTLKIPFSTPIHAYSSLWSWVWHRCMPRSFSNYTCI